MRPLSLILPALCLGFAVPLAAQGSTSPFLPAGAAAAGPNGSTPGGAIELRGEMSTPAGMQYCIYDTAKKISTWVGLNERGNAFVVVRADLARDTVSVMYQGRTLNLPLHDSKVASSGLAVAPNAMMGGNAAMAPGQGAPPDDAQKIQAIAAEVARRRMLREQEIQKGNAQGGLPPPPSPGVSRPPPGR